MPPEQITLHGNNKSLDELARAVSAGVGHIVADSFDEIARLAYLTDRSGPPDPETPPPARRSWSASPSGSRRTPTSSWPPRTRTRSSVSRWLGGRRRGGAAGAGQPGLEFAGLHSHIGSQIFDTAGFEVAAHRVVELAVRIRDEHGVEIAELDLGGGFGIAYTERGRPAARSRRSRRACARSSDGQCAPPGCPGRG